MKPTGPLYLDTTTSLDEPHWHQNSATFQRWIFPSLHSFLSFKLWHGTGVDKNPLPIWFEIWLQVHLVDLSGSGFLQIDDGCSVEDWSFWLKASGILKHLMNPYQCQSLNNVYPKLTSQHANAYWTYLAHKCVGEWFVEGKSEMQWDNLNYDAGDRKREKTASSKIQTHHFVVMMHVPNRWATTTSLT